MENLRTVGRRGSERRIYRHCGGGQKRGLQASFQAEVRQEIEHLIGASSTREIDFEAWETAARSCALRLAARALEAHLNADRSDYSGARRDCPCGAQARYVDRRSKTVETVLGPLRLERAYYHCPSCGHGFCPRDGALGIRHGGLSPGILRMVAAVGARASFEESSLLLDQLAAVTVDPKQVERHAEALGREVADDEKQDVTPMEQTPLPPTLYLGIDGTGIPVRAAELVGRSGKQADGTAKTREVKLCTVWSAEARDEEGHPMRDRGSVSYSAAIESAATPDVSQVRSEFTERVLRETSRRRFCQAERAVVIGDGAPWIWNIAQELFPKAIRIVDRFHVKQHLSDLSKALHPAHPARARLWAQLRHDQLDDGKLAALLGALRPYMNSSDEARKCYHYIRRNRHRMRYPRFHQMGLCTSSGVVEAGCKLAIGTRLKRAGMHWTVPGSNAIIALRCCILSGRFEDFWERRS
ncbi:MAG TPA: ISKra4 family transposase, partial [Bryobacteraceae bacterium]